MKDIEVLGNNTPSAGPGVYRLPSTRVKQHPPRLARVPREAQLEVAEAIDDQRRNLGASAFMAVLEGVLSPTWENVVQGQINMLEVARRTIALSTPEGNHFSDFLNLLAYPRLTWRLESMDVFELAHVAAQQAASGRAYLEFFRSSALSLGLYVLPAGGVDRQKTHTEDEVYYVAAGRGMVTVGDSEREIGPGSTVYVAARVAHHFHSITEALSLVVFFAPAEYSQAQD